MTTPESRRRLVDLEGILHKEKSEFEELVQNVSNKEAKKGQPVIDILELNHLRRQLLFQSYMWDQRLVYAASLDINSLRHDPSAFNPEHVEKPLNANEQLIDMNIPVTPHKGSVNCESDLVDPKFNQSHNREGEIGTLIHAPYVNHEVTDTGLDSKHLKGNQTNLSSGTNICDELDPLESNLTARRALSDVQVHAIPSLSDTLDAAWTGENHPGFGTPKKNVAVTDSLTTTSVADTLDLDDQVEEQSGFRISRSPSVLSTKGSDNMEESVSWLGCTL